MNWQIINADVIDGLRQLPDSSVHCCITSPPYMGLRDYQTGAWEGGDLACEHKNTNGQRLAESVASTRGGGHAPAETGPAPMLATCKRCGAQRVDKQIGLEPSPAEYVTKLVDVFREVRRVLRTEGVTWLNLGDSFNSQPGQRKVTDKTGDKQATNIGSVRTPSRSIPGFKPKDMIGIP